MSDDNELAAKALREEAERKFGQPHGNFGDYDDLASALESGEKRIVSKELVLSGIAWELDEESVAGRIADLEKQLEAADVLYEYAWDEVRKVKHCDGDEESCPYDHDVCTHIQDVKRFRALRDGGQA